MTFTGWMFPNVSSPYHDLHWLDVSQRVIPTPLSHPPYHDLHWLDVSQRVIFKLCMTVYKCLHSLASKYLGELCVPVADVAGRRQLRSASRGLLNFPRNLTPCRVQYQARKLKMTTVTAVIA